MATENGPGLKMYLILNMGMFHYYVSLPHGNLPKVLFYLPLPRVMFFPGTGNIGLSPQPGASKNTKAGSLPNLLARLDVSLGKLEDAHL